MRTPFIVGNWKMNFTTTQTVGMCRTLKEALRGVVGVEVGVAPPATSLVAALTELEGSAIRVAAQNCHWEASGAYTGEISAEMIRDLGCQVVLLGHSERRQFFCETDQGVNKKLQAAFRAGLQPIVCVGETLAEREAGKTQLVVETQVRGALQNVTPAQMNLVTLAYEPVWAIGTGKVATPAQAQEVHAFTRGLLRELFGAEVAEKVRIQYGGSVKPNNVCELMAEPDIDGALVGGASLEADSFLGIVKFRA